MIIHDWGWGCRTQISVVDRWVDKVNSKQLGIKKMTSYSVSQNQIVTAVFYFILAYTDTASGLISSKLIYALKSFSTLKFHDEVACMRLAGCLFRCVPDSE
jgi:hypothetical protein